MKNKFFSLIYIFLMIFFGTAILSCGGGGGGAASFSGDSTLHNGGGNGGWGTGSQTGGGLGGAESIQEETAGLLISQMAALDVSTVTINLTINGTPYPAINADATTTTAVLPRINPGDIVSGTATIHLRDGPTRTANLDETEAQLNGKLKFKVPYNYICQKANGVTITSGEYFSRDGIDLTNFMEGGIAGWQCVQDGSMHDGNLVTGVRGDIRLVPYYGDGVSVMAGYIKTDLDSNTNYEIDETRTIDYASESGINSNSLGYLTVTPLPSGTLYTETQSGNSVYCTNYLVTVTIDGKPLNINFTPNDIKAVKIDNIPLGSSVSARAEITVNNVSYTTLNTETAAGTVMPGGGLTMYAKYPVEYQIATAFASQNVTVGATNGFYTSSGTTTLTTATASYIDNSAPAPKTMRFAGWALNDNGTTPDIAGDTIPGTYKGKLTLYAVYREFAVTLTANGSPTATIVLAEGDSLGMTAATEGAPAGATITYSWSIIPPVSGVAPITVAGNGTSATVSTVAGSSGNAQVKVTATIAGTTITASASRTITVAGLTLVGDDTIFINPASPTNRLTLTLNPVGVDSSDLTYLTSDPTAYVSSNNTIATVTSVPGGSSCYIDAMGSGTATITVKAKVTSSGKIITATKEITVLQLVIKKDSVVVPASDTVTLPIGEVAELSAELLGASGTISYTWTNPAASKFSFDTTTQPSVTIAPLVAGTNSATVSVKATFNSVDYTASVGIATSGNLSITNISSFLSHLPTKDKSTPYQITSIEGLTSSNILSLREALKANPSKYVDLSSLPLPSDITDLSECFSGCRALIKPPAIPSGVTNMYMCFFQCSNLAQAPVIPNGVTNLQYAFGQCDVITTPPAIPEGVTDMKGTFSNCYKLATAPVLPSTVTNLDTCFLRTDITTPPVIPNGVTNIQTCFSECRKLTSAPAIPESVTDMSQTFEECDELTGSVTIPQYVTDMRSCFESCSKLTSVIVLTTTCTAFQWNDCFDGCSSITNISVPSSPVKTQILGGRNNAGVADKITYP